MARSCLSTALTLAASMPACGVDGPDDEADQAPAPIVGLEPPPPVDDDLGEVRIAEIEARIDDLVGDRSYHEMSEGERARFDALARAREFRLGTHPSDHPTIDALTGHDAGKPAAALPFPIPQPTSPLPRFPWPPPLPPNPDPPDPAPENIQYYHSDVSARPIFRTSVYLPYTTSPKQFFTSDLKQLLGVGGAGVAYASLPGFELPEADTMLVVRRGNQRWFNDDCNADTNASCVTTSTAGGTYVVTVFATTAANWGTMDLWQGNTKLANDAAFGGTVLETTVPSDGVYSFETIHVPGGATDTQLVLFDGSWNEKGYDNDGGIGRAARVQYNLQSSGHKLLVGAYAQSTIGATRSTNVVMNPCLSEVHACHTLYSPTSHRGDRDGDSLANALEEEIGTDPDNPDTDGDGLFDYIEVIGHRAEGGEQPMVLYGADPRRRDIFVEIDQQLENDQQMQIAPVPEDQIVRMQEIFEDMPTVINVDGSVGVRVHVDTGTPCSTPTLCGDWGGSQKIDVADADTVDWHDQKDNVLANLAPERRGVFRYAFEQMPFSGTAGTAWSVRIDDERPGEVLAHELGHNHGISHGGGSPFRNHKLTYPSVMNYNYSYSLPGQLTDRGRFSTGDLVTIDHRWLDETNYAVGQPKTHFSANPYRLGVSGDDVDFNRDGRISDSPVLFDDGPVDIQRSGSWPEITNARAIDPALATGGPGIAVEELNASGSVATTWVFASNQGGDPYPDVSSITDMVGDVQDFPPFQGGVPLPGGGLPWGETSAHFFAMDQGDRIVVTFPNAAGVLHYNLFDPDTGFASWAPIPGFPEGAGARTASLAEIDGRVAVVFRDYEADDGVPNTWLVRLDSDGNWSEWELLDVPSWATPGMAEATDGNEYLAYVVEAGDDRPIWFARRPAGSSEAWEMLAYPVQERTFFVDLPAIARNRVTLLFRRYRYAFGEPFEDDSGHLATFWSAGDPADKQTWRHYRGYTPGYVSPTEDAFLPVPTPWRAQGQITRPWPGHSAAVAPRHWDVQAVYSGIHWNSATQAGLFFVPYAGGMGLENSVPHSDFDDAAAIEAHMCATLMSLQETQCWCDEGPKSDCAET